jgi:hypothetical protein
VCNPVVIDNRTRLLADVLNKALSEHKDRSLDRPVLTKIQKGLSGEKVYPL